jgi:hypothetical protein
MPLQDISVNRNRGRSLDTSSSAEDHVAFSGTSKRLLEPRRQPVNAPGSPGGKAQADEGFVRFLKTHSSPTHQRVTAGGRIVPMEPPAAPPQFKLLIGNSIARSIAPATQNNGEGLAPREPRLENAGTTKSREQKGSTSKSLNSDTNFQRSQSQHLLAEPFPKFYDGQTGHWEVRKPATNDKTSFSVDVCIERNTGRPDSEVLVAGQNAAHAVLRGLETPQPNNTILQATATQPPGPNPVIAHGSTSTDCPYTHPQHPTKMQSSQQQALITSQHLSNKISPLLKRTSTAMTPELYDDGQGHNRRPLTTEMGPCHGLGLATDRAILYPSLFPIVPQGYRVPQFTALPMCANQLSYFPAAYYAPDPYHQPSSFLPVLPQQSFGDTSMSLVAPADLNTGVSDVPSQLALQQKFAEAEASFNHSTEQERMLDQYLAMNMDKMDLQSRRACTAKRMEIVEERAAAKDCMNQLQQALNADIARTVDRPSDCQSLTSLRPASQSRPANRLNVQAPLWVPKAGTTSSSKAIKIQNPNTSTTTASCTTSQKAPPSPANMTGTKLTPVKPTAVVSEDPFTTKLTTVIFSPEKSPVDEWGARLGAAPPELERQQSEQSELLEAMATETSQPCASPPRSIGSVSEPDGSWDGKDGRAPPQVEADHEKYLDAIRKDLGTVSVIMLSSGQTVKVDGQNYKQPRLKHMTSDFEKGYWRRKPDLDQRMGTTHPNPFERSFETMKCTPSPQKSRQTQEWVNGVVEIQKPVSCARAPWISQGMNLLSTKGEPSICLQDTHATSRTRGMNGAAGHLRGRH